jgi:putative aldouronate transport system permease protein
MALVRQEVKAVTRVSEARRTSLRARIWRERWMYPFIIPGLIYFIVFSYVPLLGNVAAFQDFSPFLGFARSPWVGFQNFVNIFSDPDVGTALKNTLIISFLQLLFFFPAPIALALLLNSIMSEGVKRLIQTVVYLPHFIGWVILISLWQAVLGGDGFVNEFLRNHNMATVNIMSNPTFFKPLLVLQSIWKDVGWGTIIFLAAISKVDAHLYEAAVMDGADSWKRMWHITLPGIRSVVVLLLVLKMGSLLSVGFEQILLQEPAVGADAGQVLSTFVYYRGVVGGDWGFATAVGLLEGLVGTVMILAANRVAHKFGEEGVF